MHENNIEILRSEALRLIGIEVKLLDMMLREPGVIAAAQRDEVQTFDRDSASKHIEILTGEQTKLGDLEMVLAVVGTMKAGKSTSINAIVGTEVLPNRNRPMTALPTLIRHRVGQVEPILKFENDGPVNRLRIELCEAARRAENQQTLHNLQVVDQDMQQLLQSIQIGARHQQLYHGADAIFGFLKELNDLVRLAHALDVPFPFADYDEIHELPVIEVEFVHLRETAKSSGQLTLLDTPGPNESGQPHLRKMLKEQLAKASAVLAVLDFTQLKSDADSEIRKELMEIADVSEGRLYTLVNKFDQKDRHGDSEEEIKAFVAKGLMHGRIRPDDVYPVSSRWGYLANRARHELHVHGRLPDPAQQPWVVDFGEEAFGRRWESKIDNVQEVKDNADSLWNDSLFHVPLDNVIRSAYRRAAGLAIHATSAKLVEMAEKIDNLLNTRETALTKSAKELKAQIEALQQDIKRVADSERKAGEKAETMLKKLADTSRIGFTKVKADVVSELTRYFQEGKQIERDHYEKQRVVARQRRSRDDNEQGLWGFFTAVLAEGGKSVSRKEADFDPAGPVMKFSSREEATTLIQKIEKAVSNIMSEAEITMKHAMDETISGFQKEFSDRVVAEAKTIVEEMQHRLKDGGFTLNLNMPSASALALHFSGSDMLTDVIGEKTKTVTRKRRQSGAWGTVCRWFNTDDWGWEEYDTSEAYYEIDIHRIQNATATQIDEAFTGLDDAVTVYVKQPLRDSINKFFDGFKQTVEQIRGDLLQSVRDQEHSQAEQAVLAQRLHALRQRVPDILADSRALRQDAEPLIADGTCRT